MRIRQRPTDFGFPAELHIVARGGHGFGMLVSGAATDTWTNRYKEWMMGLGVLKAAAK